MRIGVRQARGRLLFGALVGATMVVASSCKTDPQGEIVIVVNTDVAIPDSVDTLRLEILSNGALGFTGDYRVGSGQYTIPATFGVLQNEDSPSLPVQIRLIARKNGAAKMVREVLTSVPTGRVAALRLPIRFMCDDTATDVGAPSATATRCPPGQTCIGGDCYGREIDSSGLPDFAPSDVDDGRCFDVVTCLSNSLPLQIDRATCSFAKPADTSQLNVALKVKGDGICDPSGGSCFVILDRQTTPGPLDGWRENGSQIELAREVCNRLDAKPPRIEAVVASTTCPAKSPTLPTCGPWRSSGASNNPLSDGGTEGGLDGNPLPQGPTGELVIGSGENGPTGTSSPIALVGNQIVFGASVQKTANTTTLRFVDVQTKVMTSQPTTGGPSFFQGPSTTYFADQILTSPANVPIGLLTPGSTTFTIARNVKSSASFITNKIPMSADDAHLYWVEGGDPNLASALWSGAPTSDVSDRRLTSIAASAAYVRGIAADQDPSGNVYVARGIPNGVAGARLERVAKGATDGALTLVAQLPVGDCQYPILDGTDLYIIGSSNEDTGASPRTIYKTLSAGGTPTPLYVDRQGARYLTLQGNDLYWLEPLGTASNSQTRIMRAPKAGGAQPTTVVEEAGIRAYVVGPDRIFFMRYTTVPDGGTAVTGWSLFAAAK